MSIFAAIKRTLMPTSQEQEGEFAAQKTKYEPTPLRAMREITNMASFGAILPYTAFFEYESLFVLETGETGKKESKDALGFAIEITPQSGADRNMIDVLTPLFSSAPEGANIQISLYGSPSIISQLKTASLMRNDDLDEKENTTKDARSKSIYRVLSRKRAQFFLKAATEKPIDHMPFLVRDIRCVLTLTYPCNPQDERVRADLCRLRDGYHATLAAANFGTSNWGAAEHIKWCSEITNPNTRFSSKTRHKKSYDDGRLIKHQIVNPSTICRPTDDGASLLYGLPGNDDEVCSRLYTVTGYPEEFPLWAMGNLIGDLYQPQLGYPCPYVITMGVHILERARNKNNAQIKGARATTNAESPMAKFMPEFQEKKRDWDLVNKSYKDGMGEVEMYHQVLIMDRPDRIDASENSVRSIWRSRSFALVEQRYLQVPGILTSLPMGFTPAMHKFYKRTGILHRKITMNAVNMAPLLGEWKGTQTPILQLVGRRGQLMSICLFDNKGGNFNFAITAASGSGKSVLANELAVGYRAIGAKVFIIDVGKSYEKICDLLDGQFVEFTDKPDNLISINPFDLVIDINNDMEILKPLVAQMASPSGSLTDYDRSLIEIEIRTAWDLKGKQTEITDVAEALKQNPDPIAQRLGVQLFPFTRNGMYGRFFQGKSTIDFENDFVVLELEELKSKKDLQSVVLFIMMFKVTQSMYLDSRSRKKVCFIDEAWDLMSGGNSGKFIEEMYRRCRKYGGSVGTLTQSIQDYYKNPASQASLDNADWLFLLRQKKESIDQLEKNDRLPVDSALKRLLGSIKTEQGLYSEIYISSPAGNGVGRLMVDPFALLLYSSSSDDWTAIDHYRQQGKTVAESINLVLRDRTGLEQDH